MTRRARRSRARAAPPRNAPGEGPPSRPPPRAPWPERLRGAFPERGLLCAVRGGVFLVLGAPLVVSMATVHPYTVGKVVYARVLIEAVFALWALLAVARPAWRPPRSGVLALLAAGLAVSLLASSSGVGFERSFWSAYNRLGGVVGAAHGLGLAVVLVSVFRTPAQWRGLFNAAVAVSLAMALVAVASYYRLEVPVYGLLPETNYPRVGGTLGNATFLGGYLVVVFALAVGLLARSLARAPDGTPPARVRLLWPRLFWGGTAALALWTLTLTGSIGAFAGTLAAVAAAAVLIGLAARRRGVRVAAAGGTAALVLAAAIPAGMLAATLEPPPPLAEQAQAVIEGNPLLSRTAKREREHVLLPLRKRLELWRAGLDGFAERPLLGWGPGHFTVAYARHTSGWGGSTLIQDHAHNELVEAVVTRGALGLLAYLSLWGFLGFVIVRAVRAAAGGERLLIACAGGALAGYFVHTQTLFETAATSLHWTLLVAYAAHLETVAEPRPWLRRLPACIGARLRRLAGATALVAALVLVAAGMVAHKAIYDGAARLYDAEAQGAERFMGNMERAIGAFAPLATQPRMIVFENVGRNWSVLRSRYPAEAARLIRWVDGEAAAAVASEPENWRLHQALARLYAAAARTDPGYRAAADRHIAASLVLAPTIDPLEPPTVRER